MRAIKRLMCKLFGHKWVDHYNSMYCPRCGRVRPKTLEEWGIV